MKKPADVLSAHLDAFMKGELDAFMADYAEGATLLLPDAKHEGKAAVRAFFEKAFGPGGIFQPGSYQGLALDGQWVTDDVLYIKWHMDSSDVLGKVRLGTDTFVLDAENKISTQTFAMYNE